MNRRSVLKLALGAVAVPRFAFAADAFPSRPVKVVMPFAAGGGPDVEMRKIAPKFGDALGQSIVVENKVGAAGILGGRVVSQAAPDGYTLLYGASTFLVLKAMQPDLEFDLTSDFAPITLTATSPTVLLVRADSPIKTFADLVQEAKAKGGKMNYGSGGIGTAAHLTAATIVALAKIPATHIPLRGSVEIQASLQRGDTDFACPIAGTGVPLVKQGVARALAVSSRTRMKDLPQVPTLHELLGSELAVQETWFGLWAPKGTPDTVVAKLYAAAKRALTDPGVMAGLEAGGTSAVTSESPAAFGAFVRQENAKWLEVVKLTRGSLT
jgi:tripartite-type tricarboxylate transporter receptor subunit TctC